MEQEHGNSSCIFYGKSRATPISPSPLGPGLQIGNADGLNNLNNTQGPPSNPYELNPPTHAPMGNNGNAPNPGVDDPSQFLPVQASQSEPNPSTPQPAQTREHELYMPIANVVRIMRRTLPPHAKVADEAKEMVQECLSEFISFVTSEANEACQMERRKTVTAEDVIAAMSRLGFDHYVEPLMTYLQKHREGEMIPQVLRRGSSYIGNANLNHDSGTGGARIVPTIDSDRLPPFAVPLVLPQFGMFGSSGGNGGYYNDRSGPMNVRQTLTAVATVCDDDSPSPSLTLGPGDGLGESEVVGPSRSTKTGVGFQPYVPKK